MGTCVQVYPSKSKPGKEYHVIKAMDGTYYCDCWQWKRNRTCKHLESFLSKKGRRPGLYQNPSSFLNCGSKCIINKEIKKGSVEDSIDNVINNFFPK